MHFLYLGRLGNKAEIREGLWYILHEILQNCGNFSFLIQCISMKHMLSMDKYSFIIFFIALVTTSILHFLLVNLQQAKVSRHYYF